MGLSVDAIKRLAEKAEAFDVPIRHGGPPVNEQAVTDWREAAESIDRGEGRTSSPPRRSNVIAIESSNAGHHRQRRTYRGG